MRLNRALLILLFFLSLGVSYADEKEIFRYTDPDGDDVGDGTLIYPTTGDLRAGDLDIVAFSARSEKNGTQFEVEFARPVDRPDSRVIDAGGQTLDRVARLGFWEFNVDVYVDMDRKAGSGSTTTLPGRNATISPDFAWERAICLTPRPTQARTLLGRQMRKMLEEKLEAQKGRVDPEDEATVANQAYDIEANYFFPDRIRVSSRKVTFFVPSSFLLGSAKPEWGYVVIVTASVVNDQLNFGNFLGSDIPASLMNVPVKEGGWSDRFGSSRKEASLLPPIIDMIVPDGMDQSDILRNFDVNEKRHVALPGVSAGSPVAVVATAPAAPTVEPPPAAAEEASRVAPDVPTRLKQFPRTEIDYDRTLLNDNEKRIVAKLIEAAGYMNDIFWLQSAEENPKTREQLVKDAASSPQIAQGLQYFHLMKGRWDRLTEDEPFIAPLGEAGKKPRGAGFYPVDMTKEEFENWIKSHPEDKAKFQDVNHVIRRQGDKLVAIPYSEYYKDTLTRAARELKEAAEMSENASLRDYLNKRADSFLSNDYYESDLAWMSLDSPIEIVIGPYEVYEDKLFNYKASFEAFVCVVDRPETDKLKSYMQHIADMEKNLPIPDIHKNPNRGGDNSLRIVQEIYTAGDARRGVQTAAFNLPNDERARSAKGFKNILLKNVIEAKYRKNGEPIAKRLLDDSQVSMLSFDAFFNQVLFHEISHGVGPGFIVGPDGNKVEARLMLKETYSTIEEAKADILGVWNLVYAMDQKWLSAFDAKTLYITNAGLLFRSMRFGIDEAHGRGTAIQWNWFREKEAIVPTKDGRYKVDLEKMPEAVRSLANELLMIEASGDYDRAKRILDGYGKLTPEIEKVNATLKDIAVDIAPVFTAAGEK